MAFFRVHGDVHAIDFGALEVPDQFGLFLWVKAEVRINREDQPTLVGGAGALEECCRRFRIAFERGIEARPEIDDAQIGVGIEALHEFFPLMEHVALELVAHLVPCEHIVGLDDIFAGAAFERIEVDESFVRNHAGQREAVGRRVAFVVIAAVEVRVVFDREDLFEKDQAVEYRGFETRCDGDYIADALGQARGECERDKAADRWADDRVQGIDAKVVEHKREGVDLIGGGDGRK